MLVCIVMRYVEHRYLVYCQIVYWEHLGTSVHGVPSIGTINGYQMNFVH